MHLQWMGISDRMGKVMNALIDKAHAPSLLAEQRQGYHAEMVPDPEALSILAKAHLKREPSAHQQGRIQAATELRNAVEQAAKHAGYSVGLGLAGCEGHPECIFVAHRPYGQVVVLVKGDRLVLQTYAPISDDEFMEKFVGKDGFARPVPPASEIDAFDIEYDPVTKTFVGTKDDEFIVPVPGEVRRRRSAVAAVAERIVELIDEQSKAR